MNKYLAWGRMIIGLLMVMANSQVQAAPYNRQAARDYAIGLNKWWNTDTENGGAGDTKVDHINHAAPNNYRFVYFPDNDPKRRVAYDTGQTNSILAKWGWDCANFVTQCLKDGGVIFTRTNAPGPSIQSVELLRKQLATIATVYTFSNVAGAPDVLMMGDVVTWKDEILIGGKLFVFNHSTIVVGGSGQNVILAAHTFDTDQAMLATYFGRYPKAIAYHITGTQTVASLDVTPPTILVRDAQGQVLQEGGITTSRTVSVELADIGEGIAGVGVSRADVLLNRGDLGNPANAISGEETPGGPPQLTHPVSDLPLGDIFVVAWDHAGNEIYTWFTVSADVATGGGGGGGEGCVKHGSVIATPQGLRPIESFRPGDPVLGWTGTTTASTIVQHVWVHEGTWTLYEVGGFWLTAEHQVLVKGNWRPASALSSKPPQVWTGRVYDLTTGLGNFGGEGGTIVHNFNLLFLQKRMAHGLKVPSEIFQLGQAFSFPNPAKGVNPTLHFEVGQADEVRATLYNQAGQEVWHTTIPGHQVLIVDGTYAYETSIDVSNLGSGVYIAKLTAKKAGQRDLTATVKVAVVK